MESSQEKRKSHFSAVVDFTNRNACFQLMFEQRGSTGLKCCHLALRFRLMDTNSMQSQKWDQGESIAQCERPRSSSPLDPIYLPPISAAITLMAKFFPDFRWLQPATRIDPDRTDAVVDHRHESVDVGVGVGVQNGGSGGRRDSGVDVVVLR